MKHFYLIAAFALYTVTGVAQKQMVVYIKSNNQTTLSHDSAELVRTFTDPQPGSNLYSFSEATPTGELIRSGKTLKTDFILPDGECTVFYRSGQKLSYTTYDHARPKSETFYYPNGEIYLVKSHTFITPDPAKPKNYTIVDLIVTCNDEKGRVLVTNGNGYFVSHYLNRDPNVKTGYKDDEVFTSVAGYNDDVQEEGPLKNSKREGNWKGRYPKTNTIFTETYKDGQLVSGTAIDIQKKKYRYTELAQSAEFKGGVEAFYSYLSSSIIYPRNSRQKGTQGKVFITFVIEKDGSVTDIKILRGVDDDIDAESIRVIKASPLWQPGRARGIALRQQYTVPISFTLSDK